MSEARRRIAPRLEPNEAYAAQRDGALLIDIRSADDRDREGVIPGSLHIPRTVLEWRLDPDSEYRNPTASDPERRVVIFCGDGFASTLAAATLRELGFAHVTDMVGGFRGWNAAGLPVGRPSPAQEDCLPGMGPPDPLDDPSWQTDE